jgi:hypothetical protein
VATVPERLYVFIQFEFPWTLGPADGRYLMRDGPGAEPERVVVLGTLGAARLGGGPGRAASRPRGPLRERLGGRPATRPTTAEPAPVTTARATIIDPVPLSAESQARAWLADLDGEREVETAALALNRVLHAHRIAAADPGVHEVTPAQALVIRAGWGEGEQVADGTWLHARQLRSDGAARRRGRRGARRDRSAALRPQERLAALLGGRAQMLVCEELVLRARLDVDNARLAHAAIQLDAAYAAALAELGAEDRPDLAIRLDELRTLQPQVGEQAAAVLAGRTGDIDEEVLEHALGRVEAALRARTATGFNV